jgi:hypothetical protein
MAAMSAATRREMKLPDEYESLGDPDVSYLVTKRDTRRQRDAERIHKSVLQSHFHQYTVGESAGGYYSHSHDGWDELGHVHPGQQAFPGRSDGGYWEESGPSLGATTPAPVAANVARAWELLLRQDPTPPYMLMRWRLRLYCGHDVERTAHSENRTAERAFSALMSCPECGLDPATIVAARALGVVESPPAPPAPEKPSARTLRRKLAKAEAEVARLKAQLEQDTPPTSS